MNDAQAAGLAAADATSQWITFGRYGAGANPIIDGLGSTNFGIHCNNTGWLGGLKVDGIDFHNQYLSAIDCEYSPKSFINGMYVKNCAINSCTVGLGIISVSTFSTPLSNIFCGTGIVAYRTNYVFTEDCTFDLCDIPIIYTTYQKQGRVDGCTFTDTGYGGVSVSSAVPLSNLPIGGTGNYSANVDFAMVDCTIDGVGLKGKTDGTVFYFDAWTTRSLVYNCEITGCQGPSSPDRVPFDFYVGVVNAVVDTCNVHDNLGAMSLLDPNPTFSGVTTVPRSGLQYVNNTFARNGSTSGIPTLTRATTVPGEIVTFTLNTVTRQFAAPTQKLFGQSGGGLTDTPPAAWHFGASNTVTN